MNFERNSVGSVNWTTCGELSPPTRPVHLHPQQQRSLDASFPGTRVAYSTLWDSSITSTTSHVTLGLPTTDTAFPVSSTSHTTLSTTPIATVLLISVSGSRMHAGIKSQTRVATILSLNMEVLLLRQTLCTTVSKKQTT